MEGQLSLALEDLANGKHERCANPQCQVKFPVYEGKFTRVRGRDALYYCDSMCASSPYLTPRRFSGL